MKVKIYIASLFLAGLFLTIPVVNMAHALEHKCYESKKSKVLRFENTTPQCVLCDVELPTSFSEPINSISSSVLYSSYTVFEPINGQFNKKITTLLLRGPPSI